MNWISVHDKLPCFPPNAEGDAVKVKDYPSSIGVPCLISIFCSIKNICYNCDSDDPMISILMASISDETRNKEYFTSSSVALAWYYPSQRIFKTSELLNPRVFNADIKELPKESGEIVTHWMPLPDPAAVTEIEFGGKKTWA